MLCNLNDLKRVLDLDLDQQQHEHEHELQER